VDEAARKRLREKLEKKLGGDEVSLTLLRAGHFLVAYELLKGEIVERVHDFYLVGFDEKGRTYSASYDTEVAALDKDKFRASCQWLMNHDVLSEVDVEAALRIRKHRHVVAHELPRLLIDPDAAIDFSLIVEAHRLVGVLGRFWGRVEVDINPDFDDREVNYEGIKSMPMLLMDHILTALKEVP